MNRKVSKEKKLIDEFRKKIVDEPSREIRRQIINKYTLKARKNDFQALMDDINIALAADEIWSNSADNTSR